MDPNPNPRTNPNPKGDPRTSRLATGGAAIMLAAGIAIAAAGAAQAAPAPSERITSVRQLHETLAQAVAQERALGAQGPLGDPIGREVVLSHDTIDG
ncbi:hypothetical protein [Streptomyces sp. NPDC051567]|uniref:hypothetical protein n=1 Tax=Streptomyces sp. NPDC051567 TaxID=3365660 RepID=UPI0037BC915B